MKRISITLFSIVATTGFALGQAKQADPKAGSGAAPPKAGSAAPKAGSAAPAGSAAQAAPTPPKPPTELKDMLKQMGARSNCTGIGMGGADGKTEMKFKATTTRKVALDGWFIQESMTGTMGQGKTMMKFKMESYLTWDPKISKWRTIGVMNDGSSTVGTADFANGKWEGASDTYGGMMGSGKFRDHGDMSDPKAGAKMWGEMSMDGGKTWTKVYEITCKK